MNSQNCTHSYLLWISLLALGMRLGVLVFYRDQLGMDVDAYLAHAQTLLDNGGYFKPGTEVPTAFRPPLLPILYAAILSLGGGLWGIGIVQVMLGTASVWFTGKTASRMGNQATGAVAAGVMAFDPLLLFATASLMTETLFVFLLSLFCWRVSAINEKSAAFPLVTLGLIGGALALCRPGIWAWGGLVGVSCLIIAIRKKRMGLFLRQGILIFTGISIVVLPWVVRNWVVMGQPILTTTHGGYTLLLGNNETFYKEVISQPWGTTWQGDSLDRWQIEMEAEMRADLGQQEATGEIARDRWMNSRAKNWIVNHPGSFFDSSWLRLRRFWALAPHSVDEENRMIGIAISGYYILLYLASIIGLGFWLLFRKSEVPVVRVLTFTLLCVVSLTLIHLVYWSNMRMRAPVDFCLAIFAGGIALGFTERRLHRTASTKDK
ncbi:glycosyltransferase family 39 protein [Polystyrenella longa]|uniref:glycosyltransferase family 39 protein n=1 Tax=Polystyrenella longa TaxID=2528007 RepID=UPI0011A91770|nr:glycosyltransferase family 39 protein [Polystyrenella longa]